MKNKKAAYILKHIVMAGLLTLLFYLFLFDPIPNVSYKASVAFLWLSSAALEAFLVGSTIRKTEGNPIWLHTLLAVFPYGIAQSGDFLPLFVRVFAVVLPPVCLIIELFSLRKYMFRNSFRRRFARALHATRPIVICVLLALSCPITVHNILEVRTPPSVETTEETQRPAKKATLEDYADTLSLLSEDKWLVMDEDARLRVLNQVAQLEASRLHYPEDVPTPEVIASELGGNTVAIYQGLLDIIVLDRYWLENGSSWDAVDSVIHELTHKLQRVQIEVYHNLPEEVQSLPMFDVVRIQESEFGHYLDVESGSSFEEYANQQVETEARDTAARETKVLMRFVSVSAD